MTRTRAVTYCETQCNNRAGCTGFFFQKHNNGHEICGFYSSVVSLTSGVRHGHMYGAVCIKPTAAPTNNPTNSPTSSPTNSPTNNPTSSPTNNPTNSPTSSPTDAPTPALCGGSVPASCQTHINWAQTNGQFTQHAPVWYAAFPSLFNKSFGTATNDEMRHVFYCDRIWSSDCNDVGLPPLCDASGQPMSCHAAIDPNLKCE